MIYKLLRPIVKMALFFFFRKIEVYGKTKIPDKGPMIIVANHPSTMIDPLIIASITKQQIGFIANAGIFKNKILAKVLTYLHIIPIYRKKDVPKGVQPDNQHTFKKCHEYLEKEGTFLIFPEGSSFYELKLREIKTGTARIALSYEQLKNFKGNLNIIPIALDYSNAIQFRSTLSVTVSDPINVADFEKIYSKDNFKAVKKLTKFIEIELAKSIPHTEDKTHEEFLIKLHKFYSAYFEPFNKISRNSGMHLSIRNKMAREMFIVKNDNIVFYNATKEKVFEFFNKLKKNNLSTGFFSNDFLKANKLVVVVSFLLKFILFSPIYVVGLVTNYIPYILPYKVFRLLKIDIEYKTSVQLVVGIISFPFFYALEIWLLGNYINIELWMKIVLPIVFVLCGYIAMYYWLETKRFFRVLHFYFIMSNNLKKELIILRDEIIFEVEEIRKSVVKNS